ncbi:unnamed protein product [Larinioides sclopetarius]|uniref:Uncharacterized protein n=1 Tax=Larinioides sclopetarius TaxID=280406 RepID=A0AAV2ACR8_9ARAC
MGPDPPEKGPQQPRGRVLPLRHRNHPTSGRGLQVRADPRALPRPQLHPELLPDLLPGGGEGPPLQVRGAAVRVRPALHLHLRTGQGVQQQWTLEAGLHQGEERVLLRGQGHLRQEEKGRGLRSELPRRFWMESSQSFLGPLVIGVLKLSSRDLLEHNRVTLWGGVGKVAVRGRPRNRLFPFAIRNC